MFISVACVIVTHIYIHRQASQNYITGHSYSTIERHISIGSLKCERGTVKKDVMILMKKDVMILMKKDVMILMKKDVMILKERTNLLWMMLDPSSQ